MSKERSNSELIKQRIKHKSWYKYRMVLFLAVFFMFMVGITVLIYIESQKVSQASGGDAPHILGEDTNSTTDANINSPLDGLENGEDMNVYTHSNYQYAAEQLKLEMVWPAPSKSICLS